MNVHPRLKPFDFPKRIEEHREHLKPPVGNKLLFDEAGMISRGELCCGSHIIEIRLIHHHDVDCENE